MSRRGMLCTLAGLVLLYLTAGTIYAVATPVFEAPDESSHFFVVKHLVDHHRLPVQRGESRDLWDQEGSQPPLYYLVGAALVGWIDLSDAEDLAWANPQANIGDPANPGNKNAYIHPPEQDIPWRGSVLAVHVLRFYSLLLGAGTVVFAWAIVHTLFPSRPVLALVVAAVVASIPQFLFVTASVNNDNAMAFLSALSLYLLLRRLRDTSGGLAKLSLGSLATGKGGWAGLGVVLGLASLSKLSGLALLGLAALTIALLAWHQHSPASLWKGLLAVGVPVIAVAGWWYARNVVLYGEPTGLTAMWQVVGRREGFGADLWEEFRGLRHSFWGLFGWFAIPMAGGVYRTLDVLSVLSLTGLLIEVGTWASWGLARGAWSCVRHREPEWGAAYRPLALLLLATWAGIVFVLLVRWTSLTEGTQGRLLYPAVAPLAMFFVLGLRAWFPRVGLARDMGSVVLALAAFALGIGAPFAWIAPAYARPVTVDSLPEGAIPMALQFGDAITLRGVRFSQDTVHPGETFETELFWETVRSLAEEGEIMVRVRLLDVDGSAVALEDSYPGSGAFPTSLWPANELLASRQYLPVGSDTPAPLVARLDIGLYDANSGESLPSGSPEAPTIGRVKVIPRRWPRIRKSEIVARFGVGVSLAGSISEEVSDPGEVISVTLLWRAETAPGRNYTVFVHLVDGAGAVYGYGDGAPRLGDYPTWWWSEGEVVEDEHLLLVAHDALPGRYHVKVGMYDESGRVAAYSPTGERLPDDAVDLGEIEVR